MKFLSWNVNGIRAAAKKGFANWLQQTDADLIGVQETKAHPEQLQDELLAPPGFVAYYNPAERKGYSGTAFFAREQSQPIAVLNNTGVPTLDGEGRVIIAEYIDYYVYNVYFPNGRAGKERLDYKMKFYDEFLAYVNNVRETTKRGAIICGDFNTAHTEIDIARPKENSKTSGFLPEERAWIDQLIASGFTDSFRVFNHEGGNYSWWDMRTRARERNAGWRLDYFFVSDEIRDRIAGAGILADVMGSDHCPVGLQIT